jgi:Rrf2 family protein
MRLTRAGEYAIRCIYHLSSQDTGVVTKRQEIAQAMNIPDQFLGKIAQQLAQAGLIEIVQGAKGGMRLVVSPAKVSMLDVIEAVIGEIFLNDCIIRPESCDRGKSCIAHQVWKRARDQLRDTLAEATFDKLVDEETIFQPFCVEHIASKKIR